MSSDRSHEKGGRDQGTITRVYEWYIKGVHKLECVGEIQR